MSSGTQSSATSLLALGGAFFSLALGYAWLSKNTSGTEEEADSEGSGPTVVKVEKDLCSKQ